MSGLEAEARARQVHLESQLDDALPDVRCAPEHVQRVLLNLVTNALRHTPSDGSVFVRARQRAGELEVSVEDTGVGLSKEAQQRMFERFWRGDASRTRASGGAGLGLAIARGFVEAQGGRIWAENRPEGGARFAFTLPIAERRSHRLAAAGQPPWRFRECSSSCKRRVRSGGHRAGGRGMTPARPRRFDHEATSPRHPARASPRRSDGLIRQCLCSALLRHHREPEHHTDAESPVVGHAYVNDNTAASNTVAGFDRHADGSLTPIPGSPFTAGGAGPGAGLPSQGAIQLSSDGRYLLAVDAGSNQVSVLRLGPDGVPQPVGAPVSSGGSEPRQHRGLRQSRLRRQRRRQRTNFTGFFLAPTGALHPLPGSTVALPAGSGPDDVLFDPTGHKLVVPLVNTSTIASFRVGGRPPARRPGLAASRRRDRARSARSSGRRTPRSCSSATPTAAQATARSRRSAWAHR